MFKFNQYINKDYLKATEVNEELCTTIAMEELSELIQAIAKTKRGKLNRDNLIEEIADVYLTIDWLIKIYNIDYVEIDKWFIMKKNRVRDRLNKGDFK